MVRAEGFAKCVLRPPPNFFRFPGAAFNTLGAAQHKLRLKVLYNKFTSCIFPSSSQHKNSKPLNQPRDIIGDMYVLVMIGTYQLYHGIGER